MAHILVVDDEQDICQLVQGFLEDEGYRVSTASSASDFYSALQQDLPDIILLDIWLEGSDEDGIRVFVKHDECVGATNCCSGNKVRKLSFLLAEAIRSGATHVLTVVSSVTCGSFVMTWRRQEGYKVITAAQQHWHALDWEFPAACY